MSHCPLTRSALRLLFTVMLCSGCGPDPILEAAEALEQEESSSGGDGAAAGGPGEPGEPDTVQPGEENMEQGIPEEPEPGVPEEPEAAPPGSPGGARHAGQEAEQQPVGPQVIVRGVVSGEPGVGKIRIDMFDGDQRNVSGPRPKVVAVHEISTLGPFDHSVPVSAKRIWLGAYRDVNDNKRPDKGEPFGWYSRNPIYLDDVPDLIEVEIESEGKASGLGLDFGE